MKTIELMAKRFIDVLGSLFVIVLLSPFLLLISLLIPIESQGGIFFTQSRVGKKRAPFPNFQVSHHATKSN